jgi:hypothetical protein
MRLDRGEKQILLFDNEIERWDICCKNSAIFCLHGNLPGELKNVD